MTEEEKEPYTDSLPVRLSTFKRVVNVKMELTTVGHKADWDETVNEMADAWELKNKKKGE